MTWTGVIKSITFQTKKSSSNKNLEWKIYSLNVHHF